MKLPRVHHGIAVLALSALFAVHYQPLLKEQLNLAAFQDNVYLLGPTFHSVSDGFARGEYPYWMDSIVGGIPLYDTPQFALTYPFYFFHAGLYSDPLQTMLWLHRISLLHLFLLLLNCFVMFRLLRLPVWPAAFGAALLALAPNMVDYATWANAIPPYTWLPLVIAAIVLIVEGERVELGVLLGGASLALLALATPAHALIHVAFVALFIQAWNVVRSWRAGERGRTLITTGQLALMGVLALALSASGVLPSVLDRASMVRFGADDDGSVRLEDSLEGELAPADLAATLLPFDVTVVTGRSFVGMGAVLLALFGLRRLADRWVLQPLAVIGVYGLLSATGHHLGFADLNHAVPFLSLFREPPRHLVLFVFCCAILAAFGLAFLDDQLRMRQRPATSLTNLAIVAAFGALALSSFARDMPYRPEISLPAFFAASLLGVALVGAALFLPRAAARAALWLGALVIVATNLQYPIDTAQIQGGDYFKEASLKAHRTLQELARLPDARDYRFHFAGGALNRQFWSMSGSYYGLRSFEAYMNPLPARQFEEMFGRSETRHYYPLLGAKYHVCETCPANQLAGYHLEREIGAQKLYVDPDAMPRYTVLSRIAGRFARPDQFFEAIDAGFDYRTSMYLQEGEADDVANWLGNEAAPPRYELREEQRSRNRLLLSIVSERRAVLLLNEYFTPNWKVEVNNHPVPLQRVNLNQIGVLLEPGPNLVSFEYRPTLFVWLLREQRLAVALFCLYLLARLWPRLRGRHPAVPR